MVAAFRIHADAITDGDGSLGWRFSRVAGYRAHGKVAPPAPCQTPSRWGATSSPIPGDGRASARHNLSEGFKPSAALGSVFSTLMVTRDYWKTVNPSITKVATNCS